MSIAPTWVTVKDAASAAEVTESRLRTAYRTGRIAVREDEVNGRVRKLVELAEVLRWAGKPIPVVEEPELAPAQVQLAVTDTRIDQLSEQVDRALRRATRAEDQLSLIRNEMAQLREVYLRVSETLARREAAEFKASVTSMCTSPAPARRRLSFGFSRRRATT